MFCKVTAKSWTELYVQLTKSELGLLYYIRSLDPFGDRELELNTTAIAKKFKISVRTVQRALASLKKKGLIITEVVRTRVVGTKKVDDVDDNFVVEATSGSTLATRNDTDTTLNVVEATPMSLSRSETYTEQAIQKSETNKTKEEKEDSLSDEPKIDRVSKLKEEEREKFLSFAMKKVNELPTRPTLPSKWIAANFDDLYSEFKLSSAPEIQKATESKQFDEWCDLMKAIGKITRKYKSMDGDRWILLDVCGREIEYEDYRQSYTLEYLRRLVNGK